MNGLIVMEKCLIEQTKRTRVRGVGPRRTELKPFAKICDVGEEVLSSLEQLMSANTGNDLGGDGYEISKHCNFVSVFNATDSYRQKLFQLKSVDDNSRVNETSYHNWSDDIPESLKNIMSEHFDNVYRFRVSEMKPGHELNWHIDQDPSVICRAQICIKDGGSLFEFDVRGKVHTLKMKRGEMYFINTGWKHRVVNSDTERMVGIFGFEYKDLKHSVESLNVQG
jgi:hypothetical protein